MPATSHLKIVLILLLSSNLSWILAKLHTDDDHGKILNKMKNDFREIRNNNQYAALYVPPPNSKGGVIYYVPRTPQISKGNVIFPEVDVKNIKRYPQNYAGSTVDYKGALFGKIMANKKKGITIHTEDLLINLVFPGLQEWYKDNYEGKAIRAVYLYTYFLPCPRCFDIIKTFLNQHSGVPLYVGYTQLFGGMREGGDKDKESITRKRSKDIDIYLKGKSGRLLQVDDFGICHQPGIGDKIEKGVSDICKPHTEMLVIAMDFTSGKAQVWYSGFNPDKSGWIALLDKNNKRLTWEYTHGSTNGRISFNKYIENGAYVQYWPNNVKEIRKSYPWNDCGFGFIELNKLPYNTKKPKTFTKIKLSMEDGQIIVIIRHSTYYKPNKWDFVMIQTLDQIDTENYVEWQWLSGFKPDSIDTDGTCKFSYDGKKYAEGFRVKYVYNYKEYQYLGVYDNASPIWTPGGCQGGA